MGEYYSKKELDEIGNLARMRQAILTVVIITLILALCLHFGRQGKTYQVEMEGNKNDGYHWTCAVEDESILEVKSESYANGTYLFMFKGKKYGKTTAVFTETKAGKSDPVKTETRILKVDRDKRISFGGKYKTSNPFDPDKLKKKNKEGTKK